MDPMEKTTEPAPPSDALLDEVIRAAVFAADDAVLNRQHRTRAEEVHAAVTEAFRCALGNGL
jgi:hypothetical protein